MCTRLTVLVLSQGPLLANYSQTFIEQLRAASSPYAYSTGGAKRRLAFSDESRLQRLTMWLRVTLKKRMPWGAAGAYRRRKFVVSFLQSAVSACTEFRFACVSCFVKASCSRLKCAGVQAACHSIMRPLMRAFTTSLMHMFSHSFTVHLFVHACMISACLCMCCTCVAAIGQVQKS